MQGVRNPSAEIKSRLFLSTDNAFPESSAITIRTSSPTKDLSLSAPPSCEIRLMVAGNVTGRPFPHPAKVQRSVPCFHNPGEPHDTAVDRASSGARTHADAPGHATAG